MDFKNIIQKNVGNMKNKIPPMPNIPKLPKLKSRKIFNRSNENVSSNDNNFKTSQLSIGPSSSSQLQPPTFLASSIVNRSPSRISTISSLVEGGQQIEYNISDSVGQRGNRRRIRFDDDNNDTNNDQQKSSFCFTERLTKHYKELSEFKFSHIFGKKTIVRTTEIQVDMYKQSFEDQNNELAAERRLSRDYEFEFRSIPAATNNSADEPHTPTAPSVQSITRIPSTSFGFQQESVPNIQTTNFNEIKSDVDNSPPPLSRRKAFNSKDESSTPQAIDLPKQQKQTWKIKSFKKKSMASNDDDEEVNKSKSTEKASSVWQLRKPIIMSSSQDSVDNSEVTDNFKKSLNNILKKLPSLSSFDETSGNNSKSPKEPGMWRLQRPVRVKVSTDNIPGESNAATDSEFIKQLNKIVGKSAKMKNFINKDSTYSTTENVVQENVVEDPGKVKSMEEIEALGYGKKNMKYINMWKVRRRREIRRNEPFPINRTNDQEEDIPKQPGMWQLRRPVRTKTVINEGESIENAGNPQLAEITKSLMNLFKRNQNSGEPSTTEGHNNQENKRGSLWKRKKVESTTTDNKFVDTDMDGNNSPQQSGSSVQSRMWKFRQVIGGQSFDLEENVRTQTENKTGFWKKMSQKNRESKKDENSDANDENVQKSSILDKAKKQITSHINLKQLRSPESPELQPEQQKAKKIAPRIQNSIDSFESLDSFDHETLEDLEIINKNISWSRQIKLSTAFSSDSEEEDVITTPGFLQNQPVSVKCEIEPTIIIVSKPVPSILQYESVIQQQRLYPSLPIEPSTPPPSTPPPPPPPLPKALKHLELPHPLVLPTPPPPKRQITPPCIAHANYILSPPQSPTPSSQSPSPPLLPTTLPPELSPPTKSLPPLPTLSRPETSVSTVVGSSTNLENKSRFRHSRKPSMDSNDSESWIPENVRNRNVLELNKIEETFEQWNSISKPNIKGDSLKKWKSIDIFNGNDQIFDDFDDELKNEPIITIAEKTLQPELVSSLLKINSEQTQPSGVPVKFEKHKITRPLVKQGSLRRQFSEEKDAADLNKKRNVNKMISRFDPERGSSRRNIKREQIPITATYTEVKDDKDIKISRDDSVAVREKPKTLLGYLKEPSSLDVEIDKNDLQLMSGSTSEDDSDNSDSNIVQEIPARPPTVLEIKPTRDNNNPTIQKPSEKSTITVEKKLAPQPPTLANTTVSTTKTLNNNQNVISQKIVDIENNQRRTDDRPIIQDQMTIIKSVQNSNENISNLNINKKSILQSRQQSEDNFYSLDYSEEDETIQKFPLDGIDLVKEEYSIEL